LRSQALYEPAFRADVAAIDASLEAMIWRVIRRFETLTARACTISSALAYATFDGLFQQCLLKHLSGDANAVAQMLENARVVLAESFRGYAVPEG
jgi:hypothetical protein